MNKKEIKAAANDVRKVLDTLNTTNLIEILDYYKEIGIGVIADDLSSREYQMFYKPSAKTIVVGREFVWKSRNDIDLAYILLVANYSVVHNKWASLTAPSNNENFKENRRSFAELYARYVFSENKEDVPMRFLRKDGK